MWGGEFYYLLLLGFAGLLLGVISWTIVMVTTPEKPRERVRRACALGVGLGGYFVGGLSGLLDWDDRQIILGWALVGLLGGCVLGYLVGIGVGAWLGRAFEGELL